MSTPTKPEKDLIWVVPLALAVGGWWSWTHLGHAQTIAIGVGLAVLVVVVGWATMTKKGHKKNGGHGMSRVEISREMGELNLRVRAKQTRPDLDGRKPALHDLGIRLGRDVETRRDIWASHEDSILVIGPPRSGKTAALVVPTLRQFSGALVATSTRPELVRLTAERVSKRGKSWAFAPHDPAGVGSVSGDVTPLRWSPVQGCEEPLVAITRAQALVVAGSGMGASVTNSDFWAGSASSIMRCYLHAAALDHRPITDVLAWSSSPTHPTPIAILRAHPDAAPGWADELEMSGSGDARLAANLWAGVQRALDSLRNPVVAEACSPSEGDLWTPDQLLDGGGGIYLWGDPSSQLSVAPLLSAMVQAIVDDARRRAGESEGGRLIPPLGIFLDEAANIAPLPNLPSLLSDAGGTGIHLEVILQSLAQARHRWGEAQASAMLDASTVKLILPGLSQADDLAIFSRLAGEQEIETRSSTSASQGGSETVSSTWRPRWSPDAIRGLRQWHALIMHRRVAPVEIEMTPYWEN